MPDSLAATPAPKRPILLSVVIVQRDPTPELAGAVRALGEQLAALVQDFEVVVVDNGTGATAQPLYAALTEASGVPNVQVYQLVNEVARETAAWAGVENSLGDYVFVLDPDSDDLSALGKALDLALEGRDLVLLVNTTPRAETFGRRLARGLFQGLFRWLGGVDLATDAALCRVMSKRVVSYLMQQPAPASRYRSLPAIAGFSKAVVRYAAPRHGVQSGGSFLSEVRRGLRLLVANSWAPLRIVSSIALFGAVMNVAYSLYVLAIALSKPDVAEGWTTLSLQQSGMFFLFSLALFVLTEYLIHLIYESREGPPYFVVNEMTSAVLTRRQRLNVETALGPPTHRGTD